MNQESRSFVVYALLLLPGASASPQVAAPTSYDVSTVKLQPSDSIVSNINWGQNELKVENATLLALMANAFHARQDQISGQPRWANDLHFDITAKLTDSDRKTVEKLEGEQHRALIRALLVERFGLRYHEKIQDLPTYELRPAKGGLKVMPATTSGDATSVNGVCSGCVIIGAHDLRSHEVEITTLAEVLGKILHRNVSDHVHYSGKIDISLAWEPESITADTSTEDFSLPLISVALEDQVGLQLVATRGPVKTYVIDHLDKPLAN